MVVGDFPQARSLHLFEKNLPTTKLTTLIMGRGKLGLLQTVQVINAVCTELKLVHKLGIVHGNLEPANIWLNKAGQVKIKGFEADHLAYTVKQRNTLQADAVASNLFYMAPERGPGNDNISPAADIYALGTTMYACITGHHYLPFRIPDGKLDYLTIAYNYQLICNRIQQPAKRYNTYVPASLEQLLARCLEKKAANRYQTVSEVRQALTQITVQLEARRDQAYVEAVVAQTVRKWSKALALYDEVLAIDSEHSEAHQQRADIYRNLSATGIQKLPEARKSLLPKLATNSSKFALIQSSPIEGRTNSFVNTAVSPDLRIKFFSKNKILGARYWITGLESSLLFLLPFVFLLTTVLTLLLTTVKTDTPQTAEVAGVAIDKGTAVAQADAVTTNSVVTTIVVPTSNLSAETAYVSSSSSPTTSTSPTTELTNDGISSLQIFPSPTSSQSQTASSPTFSLVPPTVAGKPATKAASTLTGLPFFTPTVTQAFTAKAKATTVLSLFSPTALFNTPTPTLRLTATPTSSAAFSTPAPVTNLTTPKPGGSPKQATTQPAINISSTGVATGNLIWPLTGVITTYFSSAHPGLDISAACGTPALAADGGIVIEAGWSTVGYGNTVVIDHGNGSRTRYAHFATLAVLRGQTVGRGQVIGYEGSTGNSTGCHVHFELIVNGVWINPLGRLQH